MPSQNITPYYPEENCLYRALFGLNEDKTRAELGHMPKTVSLWLEENGQITANDIEHQSERTDKPDIEYFTVNPHGKRIDLAKVRAASVYWWPQLAITCLVIYLVLQNNYGIAKTTSTYYDFFFGLFNKPSLSTPFVKASVDILLPGTAVTVVASKALKVINLPRKIYSWGQETLLRVIKESFSKMKGYDLCLMSEIGKNGLEANKLYLVIENDHIKYRTSLTPGDNSIELEKDIARQKKVWKKLYEAIQQNKLAELDTSCKKKLLDKTSSEHHTHADTLLIVLGREEYNQKIREGMDSEYGFVYTNYMEAKQNNVRLLFAIGDNLNLNLSQIVDAVAKQSKLEGVISILPYSKNYHKHETPKDYDLLHCPYNSRRLLSYQDFRPAIEYKELLYDVFFLPYIMFFNYAVTYVVSICQAYATLSDMFGINENSGVSTQAVAIAGSVFIGGIRNWVTIGQKEEDAENYLRALSSSFSTFVWFYLCNPIRICCDPFIALVTIARIFCEIWPRSWLEAWIRLQQLNKIQFGIGAELATHFTYAANTLFFFGGTVTLWTKLLCGTEFSPRTLLILSLLAAVGQVSLNSMSQGSKVRQKYFEEAQELEPEIAEARQNNDAGSLCTAICAYIQSIPSAFYHWRELVWQYVVSSWRMFYNSSRKWSEYWPIFGGFFLNFFVREDAINTAFTASAGVINVIALYATGLPTWQVILISLVEGILMYLSQTVFNTENIAKDMPTYKELFLGHCFWRWIKYLCEIIMCLIENIASLFGCVYEPSQGCDEELEATSPLHSAALYTAFIRSAIGFFGYKEQVSRRSSEGIDLRNLVLNTNDTENPIHPTGSDNSSNSDNSNNSPPYAAPSPFQEISQISFK